MATSITDWELWAAAAHVQRLFGEEAALHVATRIGALALEGDTAGIATWQAIAQRLDQLLRQSRTAR